MSRRTYDESWHRVAGLTPRIATGASVRRMIFRGRVWHVVEDPLSGRFFRLSEPAYGFIGLLDGRRTVQDAWEASRDALGDEAPTQREAINALAQLYAANLLRSGLPGDAHALFRRHVKRIGGEVRGRLLSFLFVRIPLIDPDRFLSRWAPLAAPLFTWWGAALWLALLVVGAVSLAGRPGLFEGLQGVLSASNLPLLYASFVVVKLLHELGHGFACKVFARREQPARPDAGAVHTLGVLFLVFLPVPYVDASSAWALRSKWRRATVGAAGIIVELACAAAAAIVWARTGEGSVAHAIAYNVMFTAGVSTILFNGNPLLRYDGYHILSDVLEVPNLAQRANTHLAHLVKRWVWGMRRSRSPATAPGERFWFVVYAVAAWVYRIVVYVGISLFIADQQFLLGVAILLFAAIAWIVAPVLKGAQYVLTSPELSGHRPRAILTTTLAIGALAIAIGLPPAPDHVRVTGVVEPTSFAVVYAGANGRVRSMTPEGALVQTAGEPILVAENEELAARQIMLAAELERLEVESRIGLAEDPARRQRLEGEIEAIREELAWVHDEIARLSVRAPIDGLWLSKSDVIGEGRHVRKGEEVGVVLDLSDVRVRVAASQRIAALLTSEGRDRVQLRARSRPTEFCEGNLRAVLPAGSSTLPSASLGLLGGGEALVDPTDPSGVTSAEPVFEAIIQPDAVGGLLAGQRVEVRFRLADKPLGAQLWRAIRQTIQDRFYL